MTYQKQQSIRPNTNKKINDNEEESLLHTFLGCSSIFVSLMLILIFV